MRWLLRCLGVGLVIGTATAAEASSVSYKQQMTVGTDIVESRVIVHDDQMRAETDMKGSTTLIIKNAQGTFTVMPGQGMAIRVPESSAQRPAVEHPMNYEDALRKYQARRVGSEIVDGKPCDVYEWTSEEGTSRMWFWTQRQFPLRIEMQDRQGRLATVTISEIAFDVPAPASLFDLPPGVAVMDAGSLMEQMQGFMPQSDGS